MASGGGGGAAGGFGGAASNIGTGGPGGGGGGGGAAGNVWWVTYSGTANKYHYAGAYGGKGGKNGDNSSAPDGADVELTNPKYADIQAGGLRDEASDYNDPDGYESGNGAHAGGNGGARGNASTAGTTNNVIATDESGNYLLYSATDWDAFAAQVTSGINYSGKTLKLMADISVSTMAGSSDNNSFKGTFDGQGHKLTFTKGTPSTPFNEEYCAPFRHVREATIQNLKVDGSIYTSQKFAAGLIARNHCASQGPSAHITNCHVSTFIYSSVSGEGRHGGFVAYAGDWSCFYLDIVGCLYTGRLLTNNGTTMCGGFVGKWERPQSIGFSNVLFAPSGSIPEGWTAITDGATFVCADFNSLSYSGCYCTETLGTAQGSTVYSITPGTDVTVANAGNVSNDYKVSGLTFYNKPGFMYNGVFFAASGNDISLTLASSATDKVADGYQASAGTLSGIGTSYTLAMPSSDVTISAASWYPALLPDEGGNYSVNNANDWESFCLMVANGNSFNGKTVKLTTDISVTRKCGIVSGNTQVNAFSGIFDGQGKTITATITDNSNQGTAIFCYINGATIQHLISAGTITSNQNHTSGLVGFASGTNLIKDCAVTATLDITHDYAGGIVGHGLWSTTTIEGCVFAGTFSGHGGLSPNSYLDPQYIGFIWGWSDIGAPAPTLVNCLEAGTVKNIDSLQPIGLPGSTSTTTNCYFTTPQKGYPFHWQYVSGAKQAYTITPGTGVTMANAGTVTEYGVSGITSYGTGIKYRDVLYGGEGDEVSLTLSYETSETSNDYPYDYYVNAGSISGTSNPYTLTMPASNVTVSVDKNLPTDDSGNYLIDSAADWDFFCGKVAIGNSYRGKTVKLNANIDITTPAGSRVSDSDNKPFSGIFLGGGNTITVTITDNSNQGTALFCYINGATIKDLKVAGTIASNQYHSSGLVGFASGTNLIEDCAVTATLNVSSNYAGGIIGHGLNSNTTIEGCVFAGTINGVGGNRENIGGIWGWSDSGTPTLENCLEAGTYNNIASMHPMGLQSGSGTITNCYYVNPQTGEPRNACTVNGAKQAYTYTIGPDHLGSLNTEYSMMTAYENGILFDGTYYVASASISLANADDNTTVISSNNGYVTHVTLADRTLYRDGDWNTLCLPFSINDFAGTILEDATVMTLGNSQACNTGFDSSTGTLNLEFLPANKIEAGVPYIVKWNINDQKPLMNPSDAVVASLGFISEVPTCDGGQDTNWNYGEHPVKLVDGNTDNKYGLSSDNNPWVEFHYASAITPKGYALWTGEDTQTYKERNPKTWTIKAKNSGDTGWTTLTTVDNSSGNMLPKANSQRTVFALNNSKAYQYFRFEATKNSEFQLAELQFCTELPTFIHITDPEFRGVTIDNEVPADKSIVSGDHKVEFIGSYSPVSITDEDRSILFLGAANTLYWPNAAMQIGSCRAYFQLNGIEIGTADGVRAFNLNFGNDEITSIHNSQFTNHNEAGAWYDLSGRKLSGKPTVKGIYINNGVKRVITKQKDYGQ